MRPLTDDQLADCIPAGAVIQEREGERSRVAMTRAELHDFVRAAIAAVEQRAPVAWAHPDGRVVPAKTMDGARKDGGAMLSSLKDYTIPCYAYTSPPTSADAERLLALFDEAIVLSKADFQDFFSRMNAGQTKLAGVSIMDAEHRLTGALMQVRAAMAATKEKA